METGYARRADSKLTGDGTIETRIPWPRESASCVCVWGKPVGVRFTNARWGLREPHTFVMKNRTQLALLLTPLTFIATACPGSDGDSGAAFSKSYGGPDSDESQRSEE